MSDAVDQLRNELRLHREKKKAGLYQPNLTPVIKPESRSEFDEHGNELVLKEGLIWLHRVGQALILAGVCWDSRVDCHVVTGAPELYLQRRIRNPAPRAIRRRQKLEFIGGVWEKFDIPVGCVNNQDIEWLVKTILTPKEADLVLALR